MRQLMFMFFVCVVFIATSAMASNAQSYPSVFDTKDECLEAMDNGTFRIYQSRFRANAYRVRGFETFRLQATSCVKQDVAGGVGVNAKWTVQDSTISFSRKGNQIYRTDCGNKVYEIAEEEKVEIVEREKIVYRDKIVEVPVEKIVTQTVEVEKPVYINPCPVDAEFDGTTSWKSRLGGGLVQAGISGGASVLLTKARGAEWDDSFRSGAYGVGLQRVQQAANASEDGIKLRIPSLGIDQKISRGKNVDLANGVSVRWDGSRVALFRSLNGQSFRCDGFGLKKGSNLGVWTDGSSDGKTPVKTQTPNQIPIRTGTATNNGGQLPGGGVPVIPENGIPTRPTRNNFVESNSAGQQLVNNPTNSTQQSTCSGQLVLIGGKQRCVTNL